MKYLSKILNLGKDGQLKEGDQILAIDGQVLDSNISHQQAIYILQQARGKVELIVARGSGPPHSASQVWLWIHLLKLCR